MLTNRSERIPHLDSIRSIMQNEQPLGRQITVGGGQTQGSHSELETPLKGIEARSGSMPLGLLAKMDTDFEATPEPADLRHLE